MDFHNNFKTGKERDTFLFNNKLMSDCRFVVNKGNKSTKIPCHKYILGACSWEFYNLFYLMESNSSDIPITKISLDAVKMFLEFVYKETTELNMSNIWDVLKLAKRYNVNSLKVFCEGFLSENLKNKNVLTVIDNSNEFKLDNELIKKCFLHISRSKGRFIKNMSFSFHEMRQDGLKTLLKSNELTNKEIQIFRAVNSWAEYKCYNNNIEINSNNKRMALGDALKHIRFPLMTVSEFTECVENDSFLTDKQQIEIFKYIGTSGKSKCKFSTFKRNEILKNITLSPFGGYSNRKRDTFEFKIKFKFNVAVRLHGFEINGRTPNSSGLHTPVKFTIKLLDASGNTIHKNDATVIFDGTKKLHTIYFNNYIQLNSGMFYTGILKDTTTHGDLEYFYIDYVYDTYHSQTMKDVYLDLAECNNITTLIVQNINKTY